MDYIVGGVLFTLAVADARYKKIPVWILCAAFISCSIFVAVNGSWSVALSGILPGLFMMCISWFLPRSLGIGDGMLAISYGLLYGWKQTCLWLIFSFWLAAAAGLILKIWKGSKALQLPFIPFLAVIHMGMGL